MKIILLIFVVCSVKSQNSFDLQFLGDSLSQEEATDRELCDTKYCLSDTKYLFSATTQNKSVRPCDDFKEFALGTFDKYESVNDRNPYAGFTWDIQFNYYKKLRKVLSEPVNVNDSRISKGIKTLFAKCVNSKHIQKNGVSEAREYMRSFGLKFYPEKNDKDFDLKKYIEQERTNSLKRLFFIEIGRIEVFNDNSNQMDMDLKNFILDYSDKEYFELQLESYETMLYEMNEIYRNSSFSEEFTKEFKEIANKQIEFYHRLKNLSSSDEDEDSSELMTIDELNNLTSPLNLDWLTIINNQLFTKINSSSRIYVPSTRFISKIAEFLAENDKDAIADYLVYDMLFESIDGFLVYSVNKYKMAYRKASRASERWKNCQGEIAFHMAPALDALFLQRFFDKNTEDSLRKFAHETIEFALRKFKSINQWPEEVLKKVRKRLQSIKFIFGYSEDFVGTEMLEELYGDLDFDKSFIETFHQMKVLHEKLETEPKIRELLELKTRSYEFTYRSEGNIIFIKSLYLDYPFYHDLRPRYYNTATVSIVIFGTVYEILKEYVRNNEPKFNDKYQYGYEFYESWLESGGEELNLGANRLTNRQLYWVAVARTIFSKTTETETKNKLIEFHEFISSNPGFKEAYNCNHQFDL